MDKPDASPPSPSAETLPPETPLQTLFRLSDAQWEKVWNAALAGAALSLAMQAQAKEDGES